MRNPINDSLELSEVFKSRVLLSQPQNNSGLSRSRMRKQNQQELKRQEEIEKLKEISTKVMKDCKPAEKRPSVRKKSTNDKSPEKRATSRTSLKAGKGDERKSVASRKR